MRNPEMIATTGQHDDPILEIQDRKGRDKINAIQNNEVYQLDSDIMSCPGPRIGEAVELVAKTAYPELFN